MLLLIVLLIVLLMVLLSFDFLEEMLLSVFLLF